MCLLECFKKSFHADARASSLRPTLASNSRQTRADPSHDGRLSKIRCWPKSARAQSIAVPRPVGFGVHSSECQTIVRWIARFAPDRIPAQRSAPAFAATLVDTPGRTPSVCPACDTRPACLLWESGLDERAEADTHRRVVPSHNRPNCCSRCASKPATDCRSTPPLPPFSLTLPQARPSTHSLVYKPCRSMNGPSSLPSG